MNRFIKAFIIAIKFLSISTISILLIRFSILAYYENKIGFSYNFLFDQTFQQHKGIIGTLLLIITLVIYSLIYKLNHSNIFVTWKFSKVSITSIIIAIFIGISLQFFIIILGYKYFSYNNHLIFGNPGLYIGNRIFQYQVMESVLCIGLIVPLLEEIIFRGIIFGELKKIVSLKSSILIQAILFTLVHSGLSIPGAFVLGLLGGYFYSKYKSLWLPVVLHASINLTALGFSILNSKLIADHYGFLLMAVSLAILIFLLGITFKGTHLKLSSKAIEY